MDSSLLTGLGVFSLLCFSAADAVKNDKNILSDRKRRLKKGAILGLLLSFLPCLLLYLVNSSNVEKGEPAYTTLQWVIAFPLSALIFTTIFTLLFVVRPHPSRNTFSFLKIFTMIFWAGAIGFTFFSSVFVVHNIALLLI